MNKFYLFIYLYSFVNWKYKCKEYIIFITKKRVYIIFEKKKEKTINKKIKSNNNKTDHI
jgi:hypothetical protein